MHTFVCREVELSMKLLQLSSSLSLQDACICGKADIHIKGISWYLCPFSDICVLCLKITQVIYVNSTSSYYSFISIVDVICNVMLLVKKLYWQELVKST